MTSTTRTSLAQAVTYRVTEGFLSLSRPFNPSLSRFQSNWTQSRVMKVTLVRLARMLTSRNRRNKRFTTILTALLVVRTDIETTEQTRQLEFKTDGKNECAFVLMFFLYHVLTKPERECLLLVCQAVQVWHHVCYP